MSRKSVVPVPLPFCASHVMIEVNELRFRLLLFLCLFPILCCSSGLCFVLFPGIGHVLCHKNKSVTYKHQNRGKADFSPAGFAAGSDAAAAIPSSFSDSERAFFFTGDASDDMLSEMSGQMADDGSELSLMREVNVISDRVNQVSDFW